MRIIADVNDLENELRRVVRGDVRFDPASKLLYSTDASMYQVDPIGVVIPRDATTCRRCGWRARRWRSLPGAALAHRQTVNTPS